MTYDGQNRITTRDIVTIAILSSLGGALSTFIGYLGNLINLSLGVPFGAQRASRLPMGRGYPSSFKVGIWG